MKSFLPYVIIAGLVAFLFFNNKKESVTTYIQGDTVYSTVIIDSLVPYEVITYNTDTLWLHDTINTESTDTVYVYNDFFKMYNYKLDTTISEMNIVTDIKITQNRLYQYKIQAKNNRKTSIITTKDSNFGIGVVVGVDFLSPTISYEIKGHQFGLGYNFVNTGMTLMYQYKFDAKNIFKKD